VVGHPGQWGWSNPYLAFQLEARTPLPRGTVRSVSLCTTVRGLEGRGMQEDWHCMFLDEHLDLSVCDLRWSLLEEGGVQEE
jgi:hypothetical protein